MSKDIAKWVFKQCKWMCNVQGAKNQNSANYLTADISGKIFTLCIVQFSCTFFYF